MKVARARLGRVFVIRLEDGDILHEAVEALAVREKIRAAALVVVGGADEGSRLIVGPRAGRRRPIHPVEIPLAGVHEFTGTGTVFPDARGKPVLHMHIAAGRGRKALAGCVRQGVRIWHVAEIVLFELRGVAAARRLDPATGFELLAL